MTGNCETCAGHIVEALKGAGVDSEDIVDIGDGDVTACDQIIVGAPTWHTGADSERSGTVWDEVRRGAEGVSPWSGVYTTPESTHANDLPRPHPSGYTTPSLGLTSAERR